MSDLFAEFTGQRFGPVPFQLSNDRVADYISATSDHPSRWIRQAPPGMISGALFAVAGEMLEQLADYTVIHGEQTFAWHQPLLVDEPYQTVGTIARVRPRADMWFINYSLELFGHTNQLAVEGKSVFIASKPSRPPNLDGPPTPTTADEPDQSDICSDQKTAQLLPAPFERAGTDPIVEQDRPSAGDKFGPWRRSASRLDLLQYAAATGDWNPIHWDHRSALKGGFPTIICHGLLQLGWLLQPFITLNPPAEVPPISTAKIRFRAPLPVASAAVLSGQMAQEGGQATLSLPPGKGVGSEPTIVATARVSL